MAFFDRLYRGYSAEHWISGELFARSFEAFRLPADFGFDLVVTNQLKASKGEVEHADVFPFAFQVKSRWVTAEQINTGANNRPQAEFAYRLKQSELELLEGHRNSAIAFVFYLTPQMQAPRMFVVHSRDLGTLKSDGFLREVKDGFELLVRFHDLPLIGRDELIEELAKADHLSPEGMNKLRAKLPEWLPSTWNAHPYFCLAKDAEDGGKREWEFAMFCTDLSDFPNIPDALTGQRAAARHKELIAAAAAAGRNP
ncbi:hypothetical protein RDV84_24875 [Lysobacter yananisis]|uniref:DUF4365 domain-containing protein n=1 Tax=Lysobacter yananisis TaxID=1003114 RepID=A0ABY9P8A8_9GAMM|nr:hypothetical protein [Lysobacter yananisis]WMT03149.1 hypothetical protein RDV84_24875 [Lysobacter yananisis]